MEEIDLRLGDGRILHVYDTAPGDSARVTVLWHHGTPNLGAPPAPLVEAGEWLGLRWISFDRPGYGGSAPMPGRTMATVAEDARHVADELGIGEFSVMGHSGGGSHALGTAAVLRDRVQAVVALAGIAPYGVRGLDWFAGMIPSGVATLSAALEGREAKAAFEASDFEYDHQFLPADLAIFDGEWSWLGTVAGDVALAAGPYGQIDDDIAYVTPWGCDPTTITAPMLLLHGERDGIIPCSHAAWLAEHCLTAELRLLPDQGHLSVLTSAESALDWLRDQADRA